MASMHRIALLAAFAALAFAADQRPPAQHQRAPAPKPAAAAARLSDAQIEADIRARLAKSKIGADGFKVKVQGGVATFEGRTDVVQHKGVATRIARTAGAAAVDNRIQVSDAARKKAAANLEKGRRRVQVKRGEARSESR
jgi:BON domain-containing protein